MSAGKALRYLQQLQGALDTGRYDEISELSRKVRKHDITKTCYARCVEVQASLLLILSKSKDALDDANFNDRSGRFHWLSLRDLELREAKALLDEGYEAASSASPGDREYFDLTNLFYGIVIRQLHAARALTPKISTNADNPNSCQAIALLGILSELEGQSSAAIAIYQREQGGDRSKRAPASSTWRDFTLYRLAILAPSDHTYSSFVKTESSKNHASSTRFLHVLSTRPRSSDYEKELLSSTRFPPADSTNIILLDHVSSVVDPWIADGADPFKAEGILEILYESARKTFHSPRLMRYIFHALSVLERYDEALMALQAYLQISIHAQKTQPGDDIDTPNQIISVVLFAMSNTFRTAPVDWQGHVHSRTLRKRLDKISSDLHVVNQETLAMIDEARGLSYLTEFEALYNSEVLENAIACLLPAIEQGASLARLLALTTAYIYHNDLPSAMACIKRALELDGLDTLALLMFANLLCAEELFDRALIVLGKIQPASNLHSSRYLAQKNAYLARLMELRIIEGTTGGKEASEHSSVVFASFAEYFTGVVADSQQSGASHNLNHAENHASSINGHGAALHTGNQETSRSSNQNSVDATDRRSGDADSGSIRQNNRSASLRLPPQHHHHHLHIPHPHLHRRKAASLRSSRKPTTPPDSSSRSSSPMNHRPLTVRSILSLPPDTETSQTQSRDLPTAHSNRAKRQRRLLADLWLYEARLLRTSGASVGDVEQAIEEARMLVGQTPEVLVASIESKLQDLQSIDRLSQEQLVTIEEAYEYALSLDDENETTILSFASFLIDDKFAKQQDCKSVAEKDFDVGRPAKAYELLEYLKSSLGALNPLLWQLSGDVAMIRGDRESAETNYWKSVELSDCAGIIEWSRLIMDK